MQKYRKKPIIIDAVLFNGSSTRKHDILKWIKTGEYTQSKVETRDIVSLEIETLEGLMTANAGDYIIKGIQGEFYPCKPDIFHDTYEKA